METKQPSKPLPKLFWIILVSILFGAVAMIAIRFATYKPDTVHYHANFALYINGQKDAFDGPGYYEEVQACMSDHSNDPKVRVHMHGNVNSAVHVHANGATWGQFFANLGYTIGDNIIETPKGLFVSGQDDNKLTFILNGKPVDTAANRVIGDDDVMLIDYGKDKPDTLQDRHKEIPRTAEKYDQGHDPAGCAGDKPLTFWERLKIAVGSNS